MMSSSSSSEAGSGIAPVILVVGKEAALRDAAMARIRKEVLAEAMPEFNEDRFDLATAGTHSARIIAAARTLPVLARSRLVIVRGLSDRRAAEFIESELPSYLENPVASTCLVLEAAKVDRRLQWVKQIAKLGEVLDCSGPSRPAELRAWVEARIAERGRRAGRGAAANLLDLIGSNLDLLAAEVDKVCLYVGERTQISSDDVAAVTGVLRPRALYELTDAIGYRRVGPALSILGQLLDQGEAPLAMLGALANHFRRLMRARECQPLDAGEIQRQLSVHPYAAQRLAEQARSFDPRRLRACLAAIRRTDETLKGAVSLPAGLAIERLVLAVCA
jgi:DNA polymerase-3 subunit delta